MCIDFRQIGICVECELRDFFFLHGLLRIVSLQQFLIKNSSHSKKMEKEKKDLRKIKWVQDSCNLFSEAMQRS